MPLGRRISRILKSKESEGKQQSASGSHITATASGAFFTIDEADEQVILTTPSASLFNQNARLEAQLQEQAGYISRHKREAFENARRIEHLNDLLTSRAVHDETILRSLLDARNRIDSLRQSHSIEVTNLNERLQALNIQLESLRAEKLRVDDENKAIQKDFQQNFCLSQQQYQQDFQKQAIQIRDREQQLLAVVEPMDEASRATYNTRLNDSHAKYDLEVNLKAQNASLTEEIGMLKSALEAQHLQNSELRNTVQTYQQEISALTNNLQAQQQETLILNVQISDLQGQLEAAKHVYDDTKSTIDTLYAVRANLMDELEELKSSQAKFQSLVCDGITPRQILTSKLLGQWHPKLQAEQISDSPRFLQTHRVQHLSPHLFDLALTEQDEITTFLHSIKFASRRTFPLRELEVQQCSVCETLKFNVTTTPSRIGRLSEFSHEFQQTSCCSNAVCSTCVIDSLKRSITEDWWCRPWSASWLNCPVGYCLERADITSAEQILNIFRAAGDQETEMYSLMFEQATERRQKLASLNPQPNPDAMLASAKLHKQLITFGIMNAFTTQPDNATQETVGGRELSAGVVIMGHVDQRDLDVPIFTSLFRRSTAPKDCVICAESFLEIDIDSAEHWRKACNGYHGPWMSEVLNFPTADILRCDHDMDVCKRCIQRHLSILLRDQGKGACGRLTCPQCNRVLTYDEIRCLADEETAQIYDRYLFLDYISALPNFRWCLKDSCEDGQIFDQDPEDLVPHIYCDSCGFGMCFTHQTPWHEGLTCDQFDSQQEHGDPEFRRTQTWLRANCKNCPGEDCGVSIHKNDGCFHMTCKRCRHEFCWECLADWKLIKPSWDRPYVQNAHNPGCWFRDNSLEPTEINGNDVEEALRRRNDN